MKLNILGVFDYPFNMENVLVTVVSYKYYLLFTIILLDSIVFDMSYFNTYCVFFFL